MDCNEAVYQLKIKYDNTKGKYGIVFIDSNEAALLNRETILEKVRSITSRFNDSKEEELKIQYLDDEKNFVNLSSDVSCVRELLRCAVQVENANFKRITLQIEESSSPLPRAQPQSQQSSLGRRRFCQQTVVSPSSMPSNPKEKKTGSFSRRSLDFPPRQNPQNVPSTSSTAHGTFMKAPIFASPLEKFLGSQKEKLRRLEEDERKVVENINVFQMNKNTCPPNTGQSGPTCSNCHRQERHNRLNCPYVTCDTSFHCGAINRHPEEKAQLKEYQKQHQDIKNELSSLRNEIAVKEAATKSIQQRYVYQVRQQLIQSDPERYLNTGDNGQRVENWFQLNQDAKKLEVYLKGKLPRPQSDIQGLLSQAEIENSSRIICTNNSGKTSVRNPYKKLWQDRGVQWPKKSVHSTSVASEEAINSTGNLRATLLEEENELWQLDRDADRPEKFVGSLNFANEESNPADYLSTDVSNCNDYFLAIGIRESLRCSKSKDMSAPESDVHQGFQVSHEGEGTSARGLCVKSSSSFTHSSKTIPPNDENSVEEQYCGLDALAEACKTAAD